MKLTRINILSPRTRHPNEPVMNLISKILMAFVLLIPMPATASESPASDFPKDVAVFIEKRDLCDHFRGEDPYDAARRKFLEKKLAEFCSGTDRVLSELKQKYRNDPVVLKRLSGYEEDIEP